MAVEDENTKPHFPFHHQADVALQHCKLQDASGGKKLHEQRARDGTLVSGNYKR